MSKKSNALIKIGNITASRKQASLMKLKRATKKIIIAVGAFRTGKTLFIAFGFAELIAEQQKTRVADGNRYAIVGHVNKEMTHKNVTQRVARWLSYLGWKCTPYGGVNYTCVKGNIEISLETFAVSNKDDYQQLQGGTYRSIFVDEAPLIRVVDLEEMYGRCSTFKDHKMVMTGNPEGGTSHPFYIKYLREKSDEWAVIRFTLLDNPIFTKEDVAYMKKIFSESVFARKVMGLWKSTVGAIYPTSPSIIKTARVVRRENYWHAKASSIGIELDSIACGIDYGETDATVCSALGYNSERDVWVYIGEYYHKNGDGEKKIITDYTPELIEFQNAVAKEFKDVLITVYCETSPSSIYSMLTSTKSLDMYHDSIMVQKVNKRKDDPKVANAIVERIDATNVLISLGKLLLATEDCRLFDAFSDAEWKSNNVRLDDGVKDVDTLDAFEYALKEDVDYINTVVSGLEKESQYD